MSDAIDMMNHQILLSTPKELVSTLSLCASYQVRWKGSVSEPRSLKTVVSPGSTLGPLAFLSCHYDTRLLLPCTLEWMSRHHLKLNLDETELVFLQWKKGLHLSNSCWHAMCQLIRILI